MRLVTNATTSHMKIGPTKVTPSSAIPTVSVSKLKTELAGKYNALPSHCITASSTQRLSKSPTQSPSDNPSGMDSTRAISYRGSITSYSHKQGVNPLPSSKYSIDQTTLGVVLPPKSTHPPLSKPVKTKKQDIVHELKVLLLTKSKLYPPKFKFDITPDAAYHNLQLLKANNFNLENILNDAMEPSVTNYGSEFKSTVQLQNLLQHHPR